MTASSLVAGGICAAFVFAAWILQRWLSRERPQPCSDPEFAIDMQKGQVQHFPAPDAEATSACPGAVFRRRWPLILSWHSDTPGGWRCMESEGWALSDSPKSASALLQGRIFRLSPLLQRAEVDQLLHAARAVRYNTDPDTIDGQPTFETYFYRRGKPEASKQVLDVLCPIFAHRVLPHVRDRFNCSGCVLCHAFVRRYSHGERTYLPLHQDVMSFVTIVIPLTPADEYRGGLVVKVGEQTECKSGWLRTVALDAGDAVLHGYDVAHMVSVSKGERYALIAWLQPNMQACQDAVRYSAD